MCQLLSVRCDSENGSRNPLSKRANAQPSNRDVRKPQAYESPTKIWRILGHVDGHNRWTQSCTTKKPRNDDSGCRPSTVVLSPRKKPRFRSDSMATGFSEAQVMLFSPRSPSRTWWNPGATLVEPFLRAAPNHPEPIWAYRPQSFQRLGEEKKSTRHVRPWFPLPK